MTKEGVAHNVVNIREIRKNGDSVDVEIEYNLAAADIIWDLEQLHKKLADEDFTTPQEDEVIINAIRLIGTMS